MLILDVLKYIAIYDEDTWYKLTLIDEDFKKYAYSDAGISAFIRAFYKCEIRNDIIHRKIFGRGHSFDDLPAYECIVPGGTMRMWYYNGEVHRADDKPAIILFNDYKEWYKHGKIHRDDEPAIEWNLINKDVIESIKIWESRQHKEIRDNVSITDYRIWYKDGLLHREDGPAFIDNVGVGHYYINGVEQNGVQV
jgi:hypothetical protein